MKEGAGHIHVFISYGRKDAEVFAHRLAAWLREQGHEPWLDVEQGIPLGSPFDVAIELGIEQSQLLLFLMSPWSCRQDSFCRNELLFAQSKGLDIVPLRIAEVAPPIHIISLNYLDASDKPERIFEQLPPLLEEVAAGRSLPKREWLRSDQGATWWAEVAQLTFEEELRRYGSQLYGRAWLQQEVVEWAGRPDSCLLVLVGEAGFGKSVFATQLTAQPSVQAVHFCNSARPESCRPQSWLGELIYQLAAQLEPYRLRLETLPQPDWSKPAEGLLRDYVTDPLLGCAPAATSAEPWVLVIDALDESVAEGGYEFTDLLARSVDRLPDWMRLVVTTRPDEGLLARLRRTGVRVLQLSEREEANLADITGYVTPRLEAAEAAGLLALAAEAEAILLEACDGNFLFAVKALEALIEPDTSLRLKPHELRSLPPGLPGLYHEMIARRFPDIEVYRHTFRPLLDCLVASRGLLPESLLLVASGLEPDEAAGGLAGLSQFLDRNSGLLALFHRSFADWLSDRFLSVEYAVRPEHGHALLADACWREFEDDPWLMSDYAWGHLTEHLYQAGQWDRLYTTLASPELGLLLRWLEQGRGEEGQRYLTGLLRHGELTEEQAAGLLTQLARLHLRRGDHQAAEALLNEALSATSLERGRKAHAVALHELGSIAFYRSDLKLAERLYRKALQVCEAGQPRYRGEAAANLLGLATLAHRRYDWKQTTALSLQALSEAKAEGDGSHQLAASSLLGSALTELAQYDEAEGQLAEALRLARDWSLTSEELRLLSALAWLAYGRACLGKQAPVRARQLGVEQQEKSLVTADAYHRRDAQSGLMLCALAEGLSEAAAELSELIVEGLAEGTHLDLRGKALLGSAATAHQRGELHQALGLYEQALSFAEQHSFYWLKARGLLGRGAVLLHLGDQRKSESSFHEAAKLARRVSPHLEAMTAASLARLKADPKATPF